MRGYRYWGMISLLGAGLALTLAGCGGGSGGGGGTPAVGNDSSYTSTAVVTTLAGSGYSGCDNKNGTSATFTAPKGVALDFSDSSLTYLYVADTGSNAIRMINTTTKSVLPFYGTNITPLGMVFNSGNLYFCDTKTLGIQMLSPDAASLTTLVGTGTFANPTGIVYDGSSNYYVVDNTNHVIRQVTTTGTTTILAGVSGSADNTGSVYGQTTVATSAKFRNPYGVAYYNGYLYVTDSGNNTIRKIDILHQGVTILAGTPGTKGTTDTPSTDTSTYKGQSAYFNNPNGITYYNGYLYVADTGNNAIRRVKISDGTVETVAGLKRSDVSGSTDGTGNATKFKAPTGIVSDDKGTLYVADTGNNKIRVIDIKNLVIKTL